MWNAREVSECIFLSDGNHTFERICIKFVRFLPMCPKIYKNVCGNCKLNYQLFNSSDICRFYISECLIVLGACDNYEYGNNI